MDLCGLFIRMALNPGSRERLFMRILVAVAVGGACGALARAGLSSALDGTSAGAFPLATFLANLLGCALMGLLVELSALLWSPGPALRAGLLVGLLGGFTTFSTFSAETHALLSQGQVLQAVLYVSASMILCLLAFLFAMHLARLAVEAHRDPGS